jgi:phosphoribosylaminoimidazole-succinocarboxamide synthase
MTPLLQTDLPGITLKARGKVRDIYQIDAETLLFVATDRISAFDCVMPNGIPDKGRLLTQMSLFWFDLLSPLVPNHLLTANFPDYSQQLQPFADQLNGRSMLVKRAQIFPVECVARGYVVGSGWKDYQRTGAICGIQLPAGLLECSPLPEPIFTPATKAETGHDENISFDQVVESVGEQTALRLRELTIKIYAKARDYAASRGIILADTKFEFGLIDGQITLADEVLTPDSSRYWPVDSYRAGQSQPSFDKQFVREYLETLSWNKQPPAPALPEEVVAQTRLKYLDAYQRLTGKSL